MPLKINKWLGLLVILSLIQYATPSSTSSGPNFPLTQIKIDSNAPDSFFKQVYGSVCIGLSIYKLDVIERYTKEKLITTFQAGAARPGLEIRFDMENIDVGKKGWTRYYPFSVDGKNFIMRIFLTSELEYQPKTKVLYEGKLGSPAVTFQVLPPLSEILSDCPIKPIRAYSPSQVERSS
jgi:hypothetical protein